MEISLLGQHQLAMEEKYKSIGISVSQNNGAFGVEEELTNLATLEKSISNKGSATVFKIKVRAYNEAGWGSDSSNSQNTVAWSSGTSTVYSGSCGNRTSATRTTYTRSGSTSYYVDGVYGSSPDCNADCFTSATSTVYSGSCGNRTSATRTTYTPKAGTGCTGYYSDGPYTASPDCNSGCFDSSTSTVYRNSCASRESATRTTYTAKAGTNCTTYSTDGPYSASPDCGSCGGACWNQRINNPTTITVNGRTYVWYYVYEAGGYTYIDGTIGSAYSPGCDPSCYYEYGRIYECNGSYCFVKDGCGYGNCF